MSAEKSTAEKSVGGLYFYSHQVIKDQRTSLIIGGKEPIVANKGINIEFNLNLRDEQSVFGYVCRVVMNDSVNIDILSSNIEGEDALWLVYGNDKKQLVKLSEIENFKKGEWIKVRLSYLPLSKSIEMALNNTVSKIELTDKSLNYNRFEFLFGVNNNPRFFTSDAAPIILKDIVISDFSKKILYYWTLREHGDNKIYDNIKKFPAEVKHPLWLIDKHIHWELVDSMTVESKPLIAFNSDKSALYVVGPSSMFVFNFTNQIHKDTMVYKAGKPFEALANQLKYNPYYDEIWSYDLDGTKLSRYSFSTNSWSENGIKPIEPSYWHHNVEISPIDSSLICFGGYGYYTYHSVFQKYNIKTSSWEKTPLINDIQPRYLSASAIHNNNMYVFGGFGNKTGEQQLSPHTFCDLYSISLTDMSVTKKWEVQNKYEGMVFSQSLIVDENDSDLYVLGYYGMKFNTWIKLFRLKINEPGLVALGDSIPYQFSDTESFCNVFFTPENDQFTAVTVNRTIQNKYQIKFYKLNYPVFQVSDVHQAKIVKKDLPLSSKSFYWKLFLLIVFLIFILGAGILGAIYKKKNIGWKGRSKNADQEPDFEYLSQGDSLYVLNKPVEAISSSFSFIGGFQAIDKNGVDVTASFTPTIKNLILLIILNTFKNNKGISSAKLDEILWSDKSETSARNNRNVNINKLRTILEDFDGIHLSNENSYWNIVISSPFTCDYVSIIQLMEKIKEVDGDISKEEIETFISLVSQGALLPNTQTEWVDAFKADYSLTIIDTLSFLAKRAEKEKDYKLLLKLSDAILIQDSIDEDALFFKCKSLVALGKKSAALSFYNNFCKNYKLLLDEQFPTPFNEIL